MLCSRRGQKNVQGGGEKKINTHLKAREWTIINTDNPA